MSGREKLTKSKVPRRKLTAEQEERFRRFCELLAADAPRSIAYRAALQAGYTPRMAKSKSYRLAQRARKTPGFRKAWNRAADEYAARANREYFLKRNRSPDTLRIISMASALWRGK